MPSLASWRGGACTRPNFDPALFDDPRNPTNPNAFFPLRVGNRWEYRGGAETVIMKVLNETKAIDGVQCIVVRDQVFEDGRSH